MKTISFTASFNDRTGYGIHATKFAEALERQTKVYRNQDGGDVNLTLLDSVSIQNCNNRLPAPSILYNVWESTEQPDWFIERLQLFDQLWVPSEWQKYWSVMQGVPEEFVRVVPEGVDPDIYKPKDFDDESSEFIFLHVGQWQPRKSTYEIIRAFLDEFPDDPNVRLHLSTDTLFPSDTYESTEERLKAHGIEDDRIHVIHFEDKEAYIERLQRANCFVSCSRSEGWGLPIIEAMACGVPTIAANWGGSTEYTMNAVLVNVPETRKPHGIFGDWDVPGQWGEPDYNHLKMMMREVYTDYTDFKHDALKESERIRTEYSWDAAAKKALDIIDEYKPNSHNVMDPDIETNIKAFAKKHGYEILDMRKSTAIFVIDCWPSSQAKMDTLIETIHQIHGAGYPVLITSHYALPAPVIQLADYYIFEKEDIMSGDDKPIYWRQKLDGQTEHKMCNNEYQGVAALNCFRNAIDFCRDRFDWIYQMSADMEVDIKEWLEKVYASEKPMVCIPYEGIKNGFGGGLWAGISKMLDKVIPRLTSWQQYADMYPDVRFVAERWIYNHVASLIDIEENVDWIEIDTHNRFDNVDRTVWDDDEFQVSFHDGAYLNIVGMSNREYDVVYSTPEDGEIYSLRQKTGMWSKPNIKYFKNWTIKALLDGEVKFEEKIDLKGKRVLISMGSKALGDTIAWIPYVEEFRKKHECHVLCGCWWKDIFDYPEIEFLSPGERVENIYATYAVGCFDNQQDKNVSDWRRTTLQKVSSDILGLEYKPIRAKLKVTAPNWVKPSINDPLAQQRYICFSEFSTMKNKLWNRDGAWQTLIDYINKTYGPSLVCVSISAEKSQLDRIIRHNGQSIEQTISDIAGCDFYVGLNHGPAWIAYALDKPVIMMTGVSEEWNDFPNPYRISVDVGCKPCFNNTAVPIDRSWEWCVNEDKYKCTREITPAMVVDMVKRVIKNEGLYYASMDTKGIGSPVHGENPTRDQGEINVKEESRSAEAIA